MLGLWGRGSSIGWFHQRRLLAVATTEALSRCLAGKARTSKSTFWSVARWVLGVVNPKP